MASQFHYQEPFPLGPDTTKYRLLTKDHVSVAEFEGKPVLKVAPEGLTLLANQAFHDTVSMPHSKIKEGVAEILQQEGYIASWAVEDAEVGKKLTVTLKYGPNRERSIAGIRRVSTFLPSVRLPR